MVSSGYSQSVFWGNETKYSSAAAINKDIGAVQSISPGEKNNLIKIRTLGGNRDYKTVLNGKFEVSGSMDYYLQGGDFLRQAFGEDTGLNTTVDSGPKVLSAAGTIYRHVMGSANSPGVNSFPSFTLEFTDYEDTGALTTTGNLKRTYTGCRVDNLSIQASVDDPVKCSVDWKAKRVSVSTAAPSTVTQYNQDPYVFYDGFVYMTSGAPTAGTSPTTLKTNALAQVMNFNFSLANNLEAGWYISGTTSAYDSERAAKFIIPKGRDFSLKLGLHYSNKEMYQRFLGSKTALTDSKTSQKPQIILDLCKSGKPGTIAAGDKYIRMIFSSVMFDDIGINGAPEDIVGNDVTVFCKGVKCLVTDSTSSYK